MTTNPSLTVTRLAIAVVAAAAVMLTAAGVAVADATDRVSHGGHVRGDTYFEDSIDGGEAFRICDRYRDNLPVGVRYAYIRKDDKRQTGAHWHTAGVAGEGNAGVKGCSTGSHNFGEGRRVWFQTCLRHVGGALTCSQTEVTTA
jgi:hypothetical protein